MVLAFRTLVAGLLPWMIVALLSFATASGIARGEEGPSDELRARIARLVEQLGDRSFAERERASGALRKIGMPAMPSLEQAVLHDDAEIAFRARKLLKKLRDDDFQRRIADFIADTKGERDHDFPAWEAFYQLVGDEAAARPLFVEMLQSEPLLLEAYMAGPKRASGELAIRCEQMYRQTRLPQLQHQGTREYFTLGSIATIYFVAAHPEVKVDPNLANRINVVVQRSPFRRVMASGEVPAMKRVLGAWMLNSSTTAIAWQNVTLALQYDIKEGVEPAKMILRGGPIGGSVVGPSIMAIARFGGEEDTEPLYGLLENSRQVLNNKTLKCQVRDLALLALLHMEGEDPNDYGFQVANDARTLYQLRTVGFETEDDRAAAFAQWAAFCEMQE